MKEGANLVWRRAPEWQPCWRIIQSGAREEVAASGLAAAVNTFRLKVKQRSSGSGRGLSKDEAEARERS